MLSLTGVALACATSNPAAPTAALQPSPDLAAAPDPGADSPNAAPPKAPATSLPLAKPGETAPLVGRPLDAFAGDTYVGAATRDEVGYDLRVDAPPTVGFGERVATRVRIEARPNWKINLEYPVELELAATGLSPARQTWQLGSATQASEHACEFLVNWQPVSAGVHAVAGELRFGMCRDSACIPVRERISVQVTIDEPRNEI